MASRSRPEMPSCWFRERMCHSTARLVRQIFFAISSLPRPMVTLRSVSSWQRLSVSSGPHSCAFNSKRMPVACTTQVLADSAVGRRLSNAASRFTPSRSTVYGEHTASWPRPSRITMALATLRSTAARRIMRSHSLHTSVDSTARNECASSMSSGTRSLLQMCRSRMVPSASIAITSGSRRPSMDASSIEFSWSSCIVGGPSVHTPVGSAGISQCAPRTRMTLPVT